MEENEWPAGDGEKDNVKKLAATNVKLERSGST